MTMDASETFYERPADIVADQLLTIQERRASCLPGPRRRAPWNQIRPCDGRLSWLHP